MTILKFTWRACIVSAWLMFLQPGWLHAQTDEDAIMMTKKNLCIGPMYSHSSWDHYWEGTFKRNNLNLGTVSTTAWSLMGIYGITDKLNVVANVPYIMTHASAGTLHDQQGTQDLSAWIKWEVLEMNSNKTSFSIYALGGASVPLTNYIADYLPLAIGSHSKTLSGRIIADMQVGDLFVTASGTYTYRNDITIDRTSYYTTSLHLTNKVDMPDMASINFRAGYRTTRWILEALFSDMITLGGFDIRKNDMPFPSNKMNAMTVGAHCKYELGFVNGLSVTGDGNYTVAGRNVGQYREFDLGIYYILDFSHHAKKTTQSNPKTN